MSYIHSAAREGFGSGAGAYERGRPDYPAAAETWLRDTLGLAPGKRVLDLGAGTGKFTARLVDTGADVVAVEPVAAMRQRLAQTLPSVTTLDGSAEAIPLPDASVDALICAQAFHWFATSAALAEICRVLHPGGMLGLIWNTRDERVPWVAGLTEIMNAHEGNAPRFYTGAWKKPFPFRGLGDLFEASFPHGHTGMPEDVIVNRTLSVSFIAKLPDAQREKVANQVRALIASEPSLAGKAEVTFPYVTLAYSARKL